MVSYQLVLLPGIKRKDLVARLLTRRLLIYATGRRMEPLYRIEGGCMVRELAENGYGMRNLIEPVVADSIFRAQ